MNALLIKPTDRILIIAPHPDDECLGCGGILASCPELCDVWLLTDGRYGGRPGCENDTARRRLAEFTGEMEALHIRSYRSFGVEDRHLAEFPDLLDSADLAGFTKIFVPNALDSHPDHAASFQLVTRALKKLARLGKKPGQGEVNLYQYEVTTPLSEPDTCLDLTGLAETKWALIERHRSQLEQADYCGIAKSLNRFRAAVQVKEGYVEAYLRTEMQAETMEAAHVLNLRTQTERFQFMTDCYDLWLGCILDGITPADIIRERGFRSVALYGCGRLGKKLGGFLLSSGIRPAFFMDAYSPERVWHGIPILNPGEAAARASETDAVIVTTFDSFQGIHDTLAESGFSTIIPLTELLESNSEKRD